MGLSIGEEVLIRPWDVWIGYAGQHRQGLVYYVRKGRMNTNGEDPTPYNKEEARHGTGRVRKEPVARNHHRGDDTAGVVGFVDAFTVPMMEEQYHKGVLIRPWDVWIGDAGHHRTGLVCYARKERMMEEVEEEFQSLSFHQHYTSSGVRSIPLQGGSAGSISAPTTPDHQLMEEEEDGASMHQQL